MNQLTWSDLVFPPINLYSLPLPGTMNTPIEGKPVLAKVALQGSNPWFEIITYIGQEWVSQSTTFYGNEQIVAWAYCEDCFNNFMEK